MAKVNVRKRGQLWQYYFEGAKINGKRNRIEGNGFATQKEALTAGNQALSEFNNAGLRFVPSEIGFSDYLDYWMKEYCEVNLKPETIKNYKKKIKNHIKPAFQKYKLKTINAAVLQTFINKLFNDGYSRISLSTIKGILSQAFLYAVEPFNFIKESPMMYVKLPSPRAKSKIKTRKDPHVVIPQDILSKIFERFPEGTSTYIPMMFAHRCGTRPSESFGFFWEDIDLENFKITINRQVQWNEEGSYWYLSDPKYDSFRTVDIDKTFVAVLRREKARQERAQVYYAEHYTRYYENSERKINTVGEGSEIHPVCIREDGSFIFPRTMQHTSSIIHNQLNFPEFDMHSFRKTHGSMLAEKGVPPKYVQHRLGHKNIQVTLQYYIDKTDGMIEQGITTLNSLYAEEEKIINISNNETCNLNDFFDVEDDSNNLFETIFFDS